jgi:hypothetical protein
MQIAYLHGLLLRAIPDRNCGDELCEVTIASLPGDKAFGYSSQPINRYYAMMGLARYSLGGNYERQCYRSGRGEGTLGIR